MTLILIILGVILIIALVLLYIDHKNKEEADVLEKKSYTPTPDRRNYPTHLTAREVTHKPSSSNRIVKEVYPYTTEEINRKKRQEREERSSSTDNSTFIYPVMYPSDDAQTPSIPSTSSHSFGGFEGGSGGGAGSSSSYGDSSYDSSSSSSSSSGSGSGSGSDSD